MSTVVGELRASVPFSGSTAGWAGGFAAGAGAAAVFAGTAGASGGAAISSATDVLSVDGNRSTSGASTAGASEETGIARIVAALADAVATYSAFCGVQCLASITIPITPAAATRRNP